MAKVNFLSLIPEKFYKGPNKRPSPRNVGELKALLAELPDTLPVKFGPLSRADVVVYNVSTADRFLCLREAE